ncbi:lipoprotein 17-related variable surface protein [Mycoplasmopsis agassizii]|uniref:Lipoprotein-associated type-17 domain-containing protein n=1 Tax=Mycoplasmopsis agassizii TaxID=33922 RepID=A0ABX4H652_9BACT|nr:lipoprotein 17-related variable surface protein [Mycoplasmopsis agassizii]PAF55355.1 hypothetical protein CJF60_01545 [Mycoplasmopsis agassizii]SMC15842.1 Lipoprotein associated domain-containing protein [Mycoplasmopsis agassizii]
MKKIKNKRAMLWMMLPASLALTAGALIACSNTNNDQSLVNEIAKNVKSLTNIKGREKYTTLEDLQSALNDLKTNQGIIDALDNTKTSSTDYTRNVVSGNLSLEITPTTATIDTAKEAVKVSYTLEYNGAKAETELMVHLFTWQPPSTDVKGDEKVISWFKTVKESYAATDELKTLLPAQISDKITTNDAVTLGSLDTLVKTTAIPEGFTTKWAQVAAKENDNEGTTELKLVLTKDDKFYGANGLAIDSANDVVGVDVKLTGLETNKNLATTWYSNLQSETEVTLQVLKLLLPSASNDTIILGSELNKHLPYKFTVLVSPLAENAFDDVAGTLKVKVVLKKSDLFYLTDGTTVETVDTAGKEVTLKGFRTQVTVAKQWYTNIVKDESIESKPIASSTTDNVTDEMLTALYNPPSIIKTSTVKVTKVIETDSTTPAGSLKVKVTLMLGTQFFNEDGELVTEDQNSGKTITLSGFAVTSPATGETPSTQSNPTNEETPPNPSTGEGN